LIEQAAQHLPEIGSAIGTKRGGKPVREGTVRHGLRYLVEVLVDLRIDLSRTLAVGVLL
jgi:hypothetical protein